MTEAANVLWPKKLGLVFKRSLLSVKEQRTVPDLAPGEMVAYQLGFSREEIVWKKAEIVGHQGIVALRHEYTCPIHGAYYLTRVVVRPLEGKTLPKGTVHVSLDNELIMEGAVSDFLPDVEPLDCLKAHPWRKTTDVFKAFTLNATGAADVGNQIGFMMPNLSKVGVRLDDLDAKENMTLEVGLFSAYYSTKISEVKV